MQQDPRVSIENLKRRLGYLFLAAAALITAGAFFYYRHYLAKVELEKDALITSIAKGKLEQILDWRADRVSRMRSIVNSPIFTVYMKRFADAPEDAANTSLLKNRLRIFIRDNNYKAIFFSDKNGKPLLSEGKDIEGACPETEELLKTVTSTSPAIGELHLDPAGRPVLHVAALAATGKTGRQIFLVALLDPEDYLYPLIQRWPVASRSGETLLVTQSQGKILFLNELRHRKGNALKFFLPSELKELPAARAARGLAGIMRGRDYRGKPVLAYTAPVPGSAWALVAKLDEEEAFAETRQTAVLLLLLLLTLLSTAGIGAFLLFKLQTAALSGALRESERIFNELMEHSPIYVFFKDENIRSLRLSRNFEKMLGKPLGDLLGKTMDELFPSDFAKKMVADDLKALREGKEITLEEEFNGRHYITTKFPINLEGKPPYLAGYTLDVTWQKRTESINMARLRLFNFAATHTLDELLQETLDEAEKLSGSAVSFYHFLEADQKTLSLQNWSTRTKAEFCKAEGKGRHYPVAQAGVWTDCIRERKPVIHNDYASLPHRKGLPPGHAPVTRELVVPVFRDDRIMAILGVGNKAADYDQADVEMISLFANLAWDIAERKQSEEALKKLQRLHAESEAIGRVGGWELNLDTGKQTWTDEVYRIHEVAPDFNPNLDKGINFYAPASKPVITEAVRRAIDLNEPFRLELQIITAKGNLRDVLTVGEADKGSHRLYGFFQDITDRNRTEAALRNSEQELREAQRLARIGNWTLDLVSGKLSWSDEIFRIFEIDKEKFGASYESFLAIIHPDDRAMVDKAYRESVKNRTGYEIVHRLLMQDGRLKYVMELCETFYANDGKPLKSIGTVQDITERKHLEARLQEKERSLTALFGNLPGIAYRCANDRNWTMEFISDAAASLTGYAPAEFMGAGAVSYADLILPEDRGQVWDRIQEAVNEKKRFQLFYRIRRKDGAVRHFWEQGTAVFSSDGKPLALEGFILDITEKRTAELRLKDLNRELEDKNQEMENFLYITTHDLRSPLVNIQGFSQNLQRHIAEMKARLDALETPGPQKAALEALLHGKMPEALDFVLGSSRKMDALITALLKVSRAGRVEMKPENTDMDALLRKILDAMRFQLQEAGADVKIGALPRCKADPGALSQIFTNLLDNAVKYRDKSRPLKIEISGETRGETAAYKVSDNGPGIPRQDLARIWNVFYSHERSGQRKGEGIGLPMVRRMVEKNGGGIKAESEEGLGTVFYVELPAGRNK